MSQDMQMCFTGPKCTSAGPVGNRRFSSLVLRLRISCIGSKGALASAMRYSFSSYWHAHRSHLEEGVILEKNINGSSHMEADQLHTF